MAQILFTSKGNSLCLILENWKFFVADLSVHLTMISLSKISVPQSSFSMGRYKLDLSLVSVH